jgi:hypothetical protein
MHYGLFLSIFQKICLAIFFKTIRIHAYLDSISRKKEIVKKC